MSEFKESFSTGVLAVDSCYFDKSAEGIGIVLRGVRNIMLHTVFANIGESSQTVIATMVNRARYNFEFPLCLCVFSFL